jgi:hypothetical protein
LRNGFPAEPSTKVHNSYAVDRYYRIGYVQSWNLNLQKDLRRGLVLEAAYMGSKGAKLDLLRAPNRAPAGSQISTEDRRLIGYADSFIFETSGAASIYHAMLLRVNRRFARGISLNGSYTWSKSLDSASSIGGGSLLVAQDDNNLRAERGLSAFDVRHRLNINYVLELPFGRGKKYLSQSSWGSRFFSNWTFTGWVALSSGSPFTARILGNASNNSGTGGNWSERADATGQPVALPRSERTVTHYFNTQAFALPAPGKFGNAGRNTIIGPGSLLLTLTVSRDIRIDENGKSLSLVCQANNLLNTPNFRGLATVVNSSNFGRITGTNPMRTLELTLRFRF